MGPRDCNTGGPPYLSSSVMEETKLTESQIASVKMQVGHKFGEILWIRLRDIIERVGRAWVTPNEYVEFFNEQNTRKGHKPLDTKGVELITYFRALDHIFKVELQSGDQVPILRRSNYFPHTYGRPGYDQRLMSTRSHDRESSPPMKALNNKPQPVRPVQVRKTFSTDDLLKILAEFNLKVFGEKLCCEDYLKRLDGYNPGVKGAIEMKVKTTGVDLVENILIKYSEPEYRVRRLPDGYLMVGDAPTYIDKYPYSNVFTLREPPPPNAKPMRAEVVEVDHTTRNLLMYLTLEDESSARDKLQTKLRNYYRQCGEPVPANELRRGLPCAVPYESTEDFHRAVVLNVRDDRFVQVVYVDFGTVDDVATRSLRRLPRGLWNEPVFARPATLNVTLPWPERRSVAERITNQNVVVTVIGFSQKRNALLVKLEDDNDDYDNVLTSYPEASSGGGGGTDRVRPGGERRSSPTCRPNDFRAGGRTSSSST